MPSEIGGTISVIDTSDWDNPNNWKPVEKIGFEVAGLRPSTPLPDAQSLGPISLAFLVHPTLTDDDLDRTCAAIDEVMSIATVD